MDRPLSALIMSDAAAIAATRLSMIAVPWLVLTEFGSPVLAGLVAAAELVPYVALKALGGPLIDRLGAWRIALLADLLSIPVVLAIPALFVAGMLTPWLLVLAMALLGALRGPADSARYAMVPDVAAAGGVPLTRVTGLISMVDRFAGLMGAALATGLVALIGAGLALLVNAGLLALAALVCALGLRGLAGPAPAGADAAPYLSRLAEGWRFIRHQPVLLILGIMAALTNLLDQGMSVVLVPVWAERGAGIAALGLLQVVLGGAAVLAALAASAWGDRLPRLSTFALAYLLVGLPRFAVFALDLSLPVIIAVVALAGLGAGFINPIIGAVTFERIPKALTGRVTSLSTALAWVLMPLGGPLAGLLVERLSLPAAFWIFGIGYFVVTLLPLLLPAFRGMARPPEDAAGRAAGGA